MILTMSFPEAKRIANKEPRFCGSLRDVQLAMSLDRKTTISVGWFGRGPRGGIQPLYAVRLGIVGGCALGGCCTFDDAQKAQECFEKYAL